MKRIVSIFFLLIFPITSCFSQTDMTNKIKIAHINKDFAITETENKSWENATETLINKYWSGENASGERHFRAKLLWSSKALYVRFEAVQKEPLNVSETANLKMKTQGLWDRDVCEIFLAPDKDEPRKYFEFEIAPSGEWLDLGIYQKSDERITDWDYASGIQSAARIEEERIVMAIKIEWKAFGKTPVKGDIWLGNIFRCVGSGETRGYLAWQPTMTKTPSFHVPEKFGELEFGR